MQTAQSELETEGVTKRGRGRQKLHRLAYGVDEFATALGVSGSFIRLETQRRRPDGSPVLETFRVGRRVLISQASADAYLARGR